MLRILAIIILIFASSAGTYLITKNKIATDVAERPVVIQPEAGDNSQASFRQFYRDNITIVSPTSADEQLVLKLELNRQQAGPEKFVHYYDVRLFKGNQFSSASTQFTSSSPDISGQEFLRSAKNSGFEDLSTRETYTAEFKVGENEISLAIADLNGDFITHNSIDYTRYNSVGEASLTINSQRFDNYHATLEKAYSADYQTYIFFDGYRDMSSTTHKFALFDELGEYYLLDKTTTDRFNPAYTDHTWVLNKDPNGNTFKAFDAELEYNEKGRSSFEWDLIFPDTGDQFSLESVQSTRSGTWNRGRVSGTVTKADGSIRKVSGYFVFKES